MKYVIADGNPFNDGGIFLRGPFNSIKECHEYAKLYSLTGWWSVSLTAPGSLWVVDDADVDADAE